MMGMTLFKVSMSMSNLHFKVFKENLYGLFINETHKQAFLYSAVLQPHGKGFPDIDLILRFAGWKLCLWKIVPFSDVDLLSFVPKKPLITSRQAYQPTMSCVTIIWLFVSCFPFLLEVLFWGWGGCACLTASMNVRRSLLWSCCDKTFLVAIV